MFSVYDLLTRSIDEIYPPRKKFSASDRPVSQEDRDEFLARLTASGHSRGFVWLLRSPSQPDIYHLPAVESIVRTTEFGSASDKVAYVVSKLGLTEAQRIEIAGKSSGQRSNPNWGLYRKGCVTASNFGPVLKVAKSSRQPSQSLMRTLLGSYDGSGARAIQWDVMHEDTAISCFEIGQDVCVRKTGIWLSPSGMLGASPDGLVGDDGIIEVKCTYSCRATPLSAMADKLYLKYVDGRFELNLCNATGLQYYHQVQGNLHLTGRAVCYFIVWTPAETHIFNIKRDAAWAENIPLLENFYKSHFLPAFIGSVV